jgi:LysM repeat protein
MPPKTSTQTDSPDQVAAAATITVQPGDTWDSIAERAGVDVDDLLGANFDLGRPGQRPPLRVTQVLRRP